MTRLVSYSRIVLPLLLVTSAPSWAQAPEFLVDTATPKQVRAVRVNTPPVIDGRLDDPIWQQAELITDFHQTRPGNGTAPSERTEVYVLYDDDALYIAARMYDSDPDQIAAPVIRHGQGMPSDDRLVVILDPFNSRRAGYRFETNLNAARHDSLYTSARRGNRLGIAEPHLQSQYFRSDDRADRPQRRSRTGYCAVHVLHAK